MTQFRIISIGTLSAHPLWDERSAVRTGHATTTLLTTGDARIIVDPGLPAAALEARLPERTNVRASDVTHVFLTSLTPDHYRGLPVFPDATWLAHEPELEAARRALTDQRERNGTGDRELASMLERQGAILRRCRPAPDRLAPGVDLFPLPGVTPGACGLLLPLPRSTVLVCGDAVPTVEHLEQGAVLPSCHDVEQAQESLREAVEIADAFVPGRDNVVWNPLRAS